MIIPLWYTYNIPIRDKEVFMDNNSVGNKLLYVAKKSAWAHRARMILSIIVAVLFATTGVAFISDPEGTGLAVAAFLIAAVAVLVIVLTVVEASRCEIRVYEKSIVTKKGLLNVRETRSVMTPIVGVSVEQSFNGKIFNYGNLVIDKVGKGWDIDSRYIKKPYEFKKFLDSLMENTDMDKVTMIMGN